MKLPTFLIIGVNKGGTTALYNYLAQHPDIFMSPVKEPMFFCFEGKEPPEDRKGGMTKKNEIPTTLEEYAALFSASMDTAQRGEASTAYFHNAHVAPRIRQVLPDCELFLILRDPIERAYSNYRMYVKRGVETRYFKEAVEHEISHLNELHDIPQGQRYLSLGLYAGNLETYLDVFGRNKVTVFCYESEWVNKPKTVIKKICERLNIDSTFVPDMSIAHNVSDRTDTLIVKMRRDANFRRQYEAADEGERTRIEAALKPQLVDSVRDMMREFYREDVYHTQQLLGRKFPWLGF